MSGSRCAVRTYPTWRRPNNLWANGWPRIPSPLAATSRTHHREAGSPSLVCAKSKTLRQQDRWLLLPGSPLATIERLRQKQARAEVLKPFPSTLRVRDSHIVSRQRRPRRQSRRALTPATIWSWINSASQIANRPRDRRRRLPNQRFAGVSRRDFAGSVGGSAIDSVTRESVST